MKIAMMVRGYVPVPRPADIVYAPIDLAVALAKSLGARGHSVDFFAPLCSSIKAPNVRVRSLNLRPLVHSQPEAAELYHNADLLVHAVPGLWDGYLAHEMFKRAKQGHYDVLHFHHPESALPFARLFPKVPVAYTLHDPIQAWCRELFELYRSPNQRFISISDNQRRDAPDLPYLSTVYNGTDVDDFTFSDEAEDYLLYVGRIVPEKGSKEAIRVAQETNHRLLIIGPVFSESQDYFDQYIKPHLNDKILYLGYIDQQHLSRYYQKAKALLTPVQWEEPFGMTSIEAMACGTPVISFRRGAAPEIITHGKNGFVVDSVAEMIAAVGQIPTIKRRACRDHIKHNFSIEKMADSYETAFKLAIKEARFPSAVRLKKAISKNLYNKVHAQQQQILSFPGRAGGVPDLPAQL